MTTQELLNKLRIFLDDIKIPYDFTDDQIVDALSDAQIEFAAETLCIYDDSISLSVSSGGKEISIGDNLVYLKSAHIDGLPLRLITQHELDYGYFEVDGAESSSRFSTWRNATGTPKFLLTDLGPFEYRMVPIPVVGTVIKLEKYIIPEPLTLTPIVNPVIPFRYHIKLLIGAAAYLYETRDVEIYNQAESDILYNKWVAVLTRAKIQLRTALRTQDRALDLPDGVVFGQGSVHTNIISPSVPAESS